MRLRGKRVLVTAAAAGIGRASAEAAVAEGAEVFATDIDLDTLSTLGGAELMRLDARDADAIADVVARAEPDVLVNCAGVVHHGTILDATEDQWRAAFELNVTSMFRTIRAALPGMLARGHGSIVNTASVVSSITGAPNRAVYGATKGAVIGLTKQVARDFVTQGIRCNAVCPGTVDTPSLNARMQAQGDYETARAAFLARQPMARFASAAEVAHLVVYLASDESAFVTGQTHVIDGGWTG
ncbi:SDR family oxidoreductase [Limibaculum sp. FT325]|uniref:SDR family oxidoreductase n=1 Tax=Thermohalobaculum sediminis TaxID=2939436 RepID=UPI0020BFE35B|nr:SDR family oxidoreductase [Limibaculum sediminis]MCL5775644.1 SDR family oxidoreductase [Limibaculum sediminis]